MGQYIHFTEAQKLRAGSVDLEEFLRCHGETGKAHFVGLLLNF